MAVHYILNPDLTVSSIQKSNYAVHENDGYIDVINILPSRSKRNRIK
ncbi:hypothetical protein [Neobacillus jeddahensis]|nr:hypothetical protein [Neobacillus jeddahensis]